MIESPTHGAPAAVGPLPAPDEQELAEAFEELLGSTLTMAWAAEALAVQPARLVASARDGELLAIPGPWPMRQAHWQGTGYFVPAWQFAWAERRPRPDIGPLLQAAAADGFTSLELHHFMTTRPTAGGRTPAEVLHEEGLAPVLDLIRARHELPAAEPVRPRPHRFGPPVRRPARLRRRARRTAIGGRTG